MDERTKRVLDTLHPDVRARFELFIADAQALATTRGLEYKAICGTRTWEEQARLYAQGRLGPDGIKVPGPIVTNARPGFSFHNFGLAIDCGVFRGGKYLDEVEPKTANAFHKQAGALAKEHGLRWGGDFKTIIDTPHFELDTPLSLSQLRDRKKDSSWVNLTV